MPRPHNPHLKEQLLGAGLSLLSQRGDASFSMRELAKEVDYTVTAIYREFKNRSDLFRAMQLRLFASLQQHLLENISPTSPPDEQIVKLGEAFVRWGMARPAEYHLMFHNPEADALLTPDEQEIARAPLRGLEALIALGNERGDWEISDPASAALGLFATLHGLLSLHLAGRLSPEPSAEPLAVYGLWAEQWLAGVRQHHPEGSRR